ncbi:phage tail sheath C-terminal domain-containing protein [Neptunomonas japonica]|uniref:Phage tail sheath protein n=1 Tax=Neptunomonas japonica JAMM 1380 TaxID=1441457 RepID=A0A7R6PBF4_9GAMM|nr:phage tail sheath C-terminal domain-containing protein [Neptunomonas japonica]BBB29394.1 phage tail sheath protein [Neptunomonas japonica JAMM 1380]
MPVSLTYPGVYIEEIPSGVRTIAGVATSITAFVGYTSKGPLDKATFISSFSDFERNHGGLHRDSPLSYAVRQFFSNGGSQAYVVRVASGQAAARWQMNDGAGPVLDVVASSSGAWGNDLRMSVEHIGTRNPDADFNLVVSQVVLSGGVPQTVVLETHRNLNLNPNSPNYAVATVNAESASIQVTQSPLVFAASGVAVSQAITFPLVLTNNLLSGAVDGSEAFSLILTSNHADIGALITDVNSAITTAGLATRMVAVESGLDGDVTGNGSLRIGSLAVNESSSVGVAVGDSGGLASVIGLGLASGGREFTGDAEHRPNVVSDLLPLSVGNDGSKGGALELIGSPAAKSGIYALLDVDLFNLLSIPESRDLPPVQADPLIQAGIKLCEDERAFYIVDPPSGQILTNIGSWANGVSQSRNAAVYFPAVLVSDPLDNFRARAMAPSGSVAGVFARTDSTRGIWKAPAGTDATINGVAAISPTMNDIENGQLNILGVNALRTFPTYGKVIWGSRTMKGADAQADEYKYVPVRRLVLFLEESLYRGTQWVVFEPNDEPLWSQIRLNLGAFMQNLFRQGAFQGMTPRQAYFVKCDKETTTQNDIDRGIVNIVVGFAPLKPAEFVIIKFQQIAGELEV